MILLVLTVLAWTQPIPQAVSSSDARRDIEFALEEIEKRCRELLRVKDIDWKRVAKELRSDAKKVKSDADYIRCLQRLIARLRDGHAQVNLTESGEALQWPEEYQVETFGPGMFWTRIGDQLYVKNSFSTGAAAGVQPGSRILKIDDVPAERWARRSSGRIERPLELFNRAA